MSDRMKQLETSLLELGTEMFRLKHQLAAVVDQGKHFVASMKNLKLILDEKGLISQDDFESVVDMAEATKPVTKADHEDEAILRQLKKSVH